MVASAHALRHDSDPAGQFVGIGKQAVTLAELVKKASSSAAEKDHRFKVFSIVGFGGVGKTTLAMELCRQLVADFPCQAMVSVSQAFEPDRDIVPLLKRVLQQVVKPKSEDGKGVKEESSLKGIDDWDEDTLDNKLKENLQDRRYIN